MYRMLLVDDEGYVLEGMKAAIPWKKHGIEVVFCAHNGQEALNYLAEQPIDIIVTDIMMPEMNGIELIEQIDQRRLDVKLIVMSAYSDFEYTKQAIRFHVFDYLLKPVMIDSLREVFQRLVRVLDQERRDSQQQNRLSSNLPKLMEKYYFDRIHGVDASLPEGFAKKCLPYSHLVAVFHVDAPGQSPTVSALYDFLQQLPEAVEYTAICMNATDIVLVQPQAIETRVEDGIRLLSELQHRIQDHFAATITVGIGSRQRHEIGIRQSYLHAARALEKRIFFGPGAMIVYQASIMQERVDRAWLEGQKTSLERSLKLNDARRMNETLLAIRHELESQSKYEVADLYETYTELVLILQRAGKKLDDQSQEFAGYCAHLLYEMHHAERMSELFDRLQIGFELLIRERGGERGQSPKNQRLIKQVTQYVHDNINTNLSLNKLADMVGLTPNYLGLIFRQGMKLSFNEYVVEVRMEEAKKLLSGNRYKVYEVAAMVGYKNTNYFSKLFIEYTGISPSEYRA